MTKIEEILEKSGVDELETALVPDGFENCCIGAEYGGDMPRLVFDAEMIIERLVEDGLSYEEAHEYFSYNIDGAYMGHQTPLYIWR